MNYSLATPLNYSKFGINSPRFKAIDFKLNFDDETETDRFASKSKTENTKNWVNFFYHRAIVSTTDVASFDVFLERVLRRQERDIFSRQGPILFLFASLKVKRAPRATTKMPSGPSWLPPRLSFVP